jgi:hypothetical protein
MVTTTAPAPSTVRFMLTMDQLHVIEQATDIAFPPEFRSSWSAGFPAAERARRESAAEAGLVTAGILAPGVGSIDDRLHPAVRGFLELFADAALLLGVRAWDANRTFVHTIAVRAGHGVALLRTQRLDDRGANPRNEDVVELAAFSVSAAVHETLRSLGALDSGSVPVGRERASIVLAMTEAQGVIEAIRTGRDEIIEAAVRQVAIPDAARILDGVGFGVDAGYSATVKSLFSQDVASLHWFRGSAGWYEVALDTPERAASLSAIELADATRVRVDTSDTAAISAKVLTVFATMAGALRG